MKKTILIAVVAVFCFTLGTLLAQKAVAYYCFEAPFGSLPYWLEGHVLRYCLHNLYMP